MLHRIDRCVVIGTLLSIIMASKEQVLNFDENFKYSPELGKLIREHGSDLATAVFGQACSPTRVSYDREKKEITLHFGCGCIRFNRQHYWIVENAEQSGGGIIKHPVAYYFSLQAIAREAFCQLFV
jgi:hypothetical protein